MTVTAASTATRIVEQPADYTRAGLSLRRAFAIFSTTFSFRLLGLVTAVAGLLRIVAGGWSYWDGVVAGAILAAQPFTEWFIHVIVLHWKPRQISRFTIDPLGARRHRQHHRKPRVIGLVLVPRPILIGSLVVGIPLYLVVCQSLRLALTAMVTSYAMYLLYEWTHFLIHSSYIPRHRYYRYIHRAHRLHHFRNENYWFGVTIHLADHVLRTFPAKDAVPVSETAFTLGVDVAEVSRARRAAAASQ